MRVLFLSANVGAGHSAAAKAVTTALRELDPGVRTSIVDSYKYAALVVSRVVSEGYLQMVKTIPQMYGYIYTRAERATEVGPFRTWASQFCATNLRALFERERPDVVVCTHAFPNGAMSEYKKMYADAPPVIGIVTDFAVHRFWMHENIDAYCVATDAMRAAMIAGGVPAPRIHVTGIPVDPRFAPTLESRDELRDRLGLPRDRSVALMMGGGLGFAPLARMLQALDDVDAPIAPVVISGKNARVEARVLRAAEQATHPVRVLPFVDNVFDYMHAADVFVTKPGGLSTAEGLAAGVPMVLSKPLPGQEERNARVLTEWGVAERARSLAELPRILMEVLTDSARRERMIMQGRRHGHPQAAADAANLIARFAMGAKEVVA